MSDKREFYVRSKFKFYILPFVIILCLIQIPAILFRSSDGYPSFSTALYIVFTMFLSMLTIVGYLLFLGHISKKHKLIEVSNGYLFCGTDKIHVSEIQSVNLLPDSGIEIITGRQTFESFHLANNNELSQAIFKQKELFPKEI
ncbi:MAG: hypothetical protein K6G20_03285 [Ruminococcus sp.]|nr:hypothetical protein [Ruminococcus sp.]